MKQDDIGLFNVKDFLFKLIKQEFGYGYIPEFHQDIINIENFYLNSEKNTFLIAIDPEKNRLLGTLGIRSYDKNFEEFKDIYSSDKTASFWRAFIKKEYRRQGLASLLVKKGEELCQKMGYKEVYLHTHRTVPGSLDFWMAKGYKVVYDTKNKSGTVHMEKSIPVQHYSKYQILENCIIP
jgi:GNAT superfamily N-acetyltransferase